MVKHIDPAEELSNLGGRRWDSNIAEAARYLVKMSIQFLVAMGVKAEVGQHDPWGFGEQY